MAPTNSGNDHIVDDDGKGKDVEPQFFEDENLEKPIPKTNGKMDYSGAHEKTDPKEIALVKKLDRWIMVSIHPAIWNSLC